MLATPGSRLEHKDDLMNYSPQPSQPPSDVPEPPQPPGARRVAVRMTVAEPRLTYVLLGIIVLIFLYFFSLSARQQILFLNDWAKINEAIRDGEYYRLVTSMFLHLNLTHLIFNSYALFVLGRDVEALFGTPRFAIIYLLGGLSGSLASFIFTDAPSVGASGAIFAIFGAEMVYFYQHRELHGTAGRQHLTHLVVLMLINLGLGFFASTGATSFRIDNAGHIGGLVGGVILAWFIGPAYRLQHDPTAESGFSVVDKNPVGRWALATVAYAAGLAALMVYTMAA
ncbi:MAG: rhomboid family intramembrane serine protease [Anaerolineae bacterium]|nr:rhomboid family intramembrane serine protease [Anaerolineae bacterium]